MRVVYVVTSGEYSAYGIEAVFSTRELAEAFVGPRNRPTVYDDGWEIAEWTLDEAKPLAQFHYSASFSDEADDHTPDWATKWTARSTAHLREGPLPPERVTVEVRTREWRKPPTQYTVFTVCDEDPERALKIMRDKVAEVRAQQAGLV